MIQAAAQTMRASPDILVFALASRDNMRISHSAQTLLRVCLDKSLSYDSHSATWSHTRDTPTGCYAYYNHTDTKLVSGNFHKHT